MRRLTALQMDALKQLYKRSQGETNTWGRVQKRIIKRLIELDLIIYSRSIRVTNKGLKMLQEAGHVSERDNVINLGKTNSLNSKRAEIVWYMKNQNETLSNNLDNLINYYGLDMIQQMLSHKSTKSKVA